MRLAGVLAIVLLLAACGGEDRVRVLGTEELPADLYGSPSPSATAVPPGPISIYFVRSDRLASVARNAPGTGGLADFAMGALLEGPTPQEFAAGYRTAVPEGAEVLDVELDDRLATVNLSKEFELSAEQRVLLVRLGQVVYTLTGLAEVTTVEFQIDAEPVGVVTQDGTTQERVGRDDYSRLVSAAPTPVPPTTTPAPSPG